MLGKNLIDKLKEHDSEIHAVERKIDILREDFLKFVKDEMINCLLANAYREAISKKKECSKIIIKGKKVKYRKDFTFRGGPSSYEYPEGLSVSVIDEGGNNFAYVAIYKGYLFPRSMAKELFELAVLVDKEVGYEK